MTTIDQTATGNTILGIGAYADLLKAFNKHMAWQNACTAYSLGQQIGVPIAYPNVKTMPGKAAKHRMYGHASRVIAALGLDVKRPSSLPEIADVIAAATAKLMAH